jgi:hypothetical protein
VLIDWLEDLRQKLVSDNRAPFADREQLVYAENKQSLIRKISKMITFVCDDIPTSISMGRKPFYGTGGGIGKESAWIDLDDVVLMSAILKSKCLCFNEYEPYDTNRPSRGPDKLLKWYQAVALGNGEDPLSDFKCFTLRDINGLLHDPRFCSLSGN